MTPISSSFFDRRGLRRDATRIAMPLLAVAGIEALRGNLDLGAATAGCALMTLAGLWGLGHFELKPGVTPRTVGRTVTIMIALASCLSIIAMMRFVQTSGAAAAATGALIACMATTIWRQTAAKPNRDEGAARSDPSEIRRLDVAIQLTEAARGLGAPRYASDSAAGADLMAALPDGAHVTLEPGAMKRIDTGVCLALPPGYEAQIRPRSGLAAKHMLTIMNTPGTIDADYRGSIQILLTNLGPDPVTIERGMRIAQMVIAPVTTARFRICERLPESVRGAAGFGSTGG